MFSNFKKILFAIFPTFKRTQIKESLEKTNDEVNKVTLPAYESANEIFSGQKFKSKQVQAIQVTFDNYLGKKSANLVTQIRDILKNEKFLLDALSKYAEHTLSSNEATTAMNLRKATVLRLAIMVEFHNRYARKLLNYIYAYEIGAETGTDEYKLTKANEDLVINDLPNFCKACVTLNIKHTEFAKSLEGIADAQISDDISEQALLATAGIKSVDPLMLSSFVEYNPFLIVGLWSAQRQADNFNSIEDEKKILELRMLRITQARQNNPSAATDREIEVLQDRIDRVTRKWLDLKNEYEV